MKTKERITRIETKLAASPCPLCGRTDIHIDDTALREKAEALLAEILPHYVTREAALAVFREHAPTLGRYVS